MRGGPDLDQSTAGVLSTGPYCAHRVHPDEVHGEGREAHHLHQVGQPLRTKRPACVDEGT